MIEERPARLADFGEKVLCPPETVLGFVGHDTGGRAPIIDAGIWHSAGDRRYVRRRGVRLYPQHPQMEK